MGASEAEVEGDGDHTDASLPATDLRLSRLELGGQHIAVISFPRPHCELPVTLSPAEREVVLGVVDGLSNADIAERRRTSARTVANQLASVFRKLDVSSRAELIARVRS